MLFHMRFLAFVQIGFGWLLLNYAVIYGCYGGVDELILRRWERFSIKIPEAHRKNVNEHGIQKV